MKWTETLPTDWERAPEDPPAEADAAVSERLSDGLLVRDRDDAAAYVYSADAVDVRA